ncbi:MAG TPA: AAA family ATPase [Candidatus Saccharimonadales bacterium]
MRNEFEINESPIEYQRQLFEEISKPRPIVIAIEGGPCGGKTTLLNEIEKLSQEQSRNFVLIPEVATIEIQKLLKAGISIPVFFSNHESYIEFERHILKIIVSNIEEAKQKYAGTDSIIVIDRADIKPYLNNDEYNQVLHDLELEQSPLISLVDKVIYLPTAAKISSEIYEALVSTNPSRYEDTTQAIDTCNRNLQMASISPEFSIYSNPIFKHKISDALFDIFHPEIEKESKFSNDGSLNIRQTLEMLDDITKEYLNSIDIYQSYHELDKQEFRLRRGIVDDKHRFYHFAIKQGSGNTRQEIHRNLSPEQYEELSKINFIGELHKTRSRFIYKFETKEYILCLDYYDQLKEIVIEIEGIDEQIAKRVDIKGFNLGGLGARELVQ